MNSALWIRAALSAGPLLKTFITDQIGEIPSSAPPEQRSTILLRRAALRAASEIIAELIKKGILSESDAQSAPYAVGYVFSNIEVDPSHLDASQQIAALGDVQDQLQAWFLSCGIDANTSKIVTERLPSYIPNAVYEEVKENVEAFLPILLLRLSPGYEEASIDRKNRWLWMQYSGKLIKKISEHMFDEPFSISQIYVPLLAECAVMKNGALTYSQEDLMGRLSSWSCNKDKNDFIRVVSGGPGSGKSSFSRMLAAQLCAHTEVNTVHVNLGNVVVEDGFITGVTKAVQPITEFDPFISVESGRTLVLILDGLDELESQGKTTYQAAQTFLSDALKRTQQANQEQCMIKLIVLGRQLAIDVALEELGQSRLQIRKHHSVFSVCSFNDQQRDQWWMRYGELVNSSYKGMPAPLIREDLDNITRQPLINYLIAIAYGNGSLAIDNENFNVNYIYEEAVRKAYHRHWSPLSARQVQRIGEEDFVRLMECLALSIWHSDGNSVTEAEFETRCKDEGLYDALESLRQDGASGIPSLLVAFFIRKLDGQPAKDPGRKYEFTHKTFREFLVGRLLCKHLMTQCEGKGLSVPNVIRIFGAKPLDEDTFIFMVREFASVERNLLERISEKLYVEFSKIISDEEFRKLIEQYGISQIINMSETLFASANACAIALQNHSVMNMFFGALKNPHGRDDASFPIQKTQVFISWHHPSDLGNFLRIVRAFRNTRSLSFSCLSFIKSSPINLSGLDISGAIMIGSDFSKSYFSELHATGLNASHSNFIEVKFDRVNFSGSTIKHSILKESNFTQVKFHEAQLTYTSLCYTRSYQTDFSAARLDFIDGVDSEYVMCDMRGSLQYSDFSRCNFKNSDFNGSDLTEVKFIGADLRRCTFYKAFAIGTDLQDAKIPRSFQKVAVLKDLNADYKNKNQPTDTLQLTRSNQEFGRQNENSH